MRFSSRDDLGSLDGDFWDEAMRVLSPAVDQARPIVQQAIQQALPVLQQEGIKLARQVGSEYRQQLYDKGASITEAAIFTAMGPLPRSIRDYVMPAYRPGKPLPQWVKDMAEPILTPMADGAKAVALQKAERIKKPVTLTIGAGILTLFFVGFFAGRASKRTR
jgi:hypothetical protein